MLAGAVPSAPTRRTDAPGTCNLHSPTPHAGPTRLLGRRPSRKQMCPRGALFHVFHLGGPPTTCSCLHSSTAEPPVRKWKSGCSQLPRPAWWTLEACARSPLALAVGLDPERIECPLRLRIAGTAVARRRPGRTLFGNLVTAMLTPEGDGAGLSSRHYLIMVEKMLFSEVTSAELNRLSCR